MLFTDTLLVGPDGAEWGKYAWRECSKGVDPLVAGEAVLVHRYELPDGIRWRWPGIRATTSCWAPTTYCGRTSNRQSVARAVDRAPKRNPRDDR